MFQIKIIDKHTIFVIDEGGEEAEITGEVMDFTLEEIVRLMRESD